MTELHELSDWKERIYAIRQEVAKAAMQDYLDGYAIDAILKRYNLSKMTFFKWIKPTPEQKIEHATNLWINHTPVLGRPKNTI